MTEESNISSILTQYFRHELSPTRMSEIQHLITTDPTWIKEYQSLHSLSQGIRHTTLRDFQSTLKNLEKTITPSGDLSPSPAYIYESNETSGLETPPLTHRDGHEAPDPTLIQGIRYTSLQDELKKLKKIENTVIGQTEQNTKKNETAPKGTRMVGMKWWAVAAGLILVITAGYFILEQNKKPKYVNQYLLDHFDEYVLHDVKRGNGTLEKELYKGYNLFYLQKFQKAKPILINNWKKYNDSLSYFYFELCNSALNSNYKIDSELFQNNFKFHNLIFIINENNK